MGDIVRMVRKGRFLGWYVRYKDLDGKRKQRASHQPTKDLARRFLVEIEARIARGLVGIPEPAPPAPTVSEVVERFLNEYRRPKIKDIQKYRATARTALNRVLPRLGKLRLDAVTVMHVQRVRDELLASFAQNSARVSMAHLGTVLGWAVRQGLIAKNPAQGLEQPRRVESIEYLNRAEISRLLELTGRRATESLEGKLVHTFVRVALFTGMRKGEIFALRWNQDVDLETRRLTVARSFRGLPKGGKQRHLKIPLAVLPDLREWAKTGPKTQEGLVFPVPKKICRPNRDGYAPAVWGMAAPREMLGLPELMAEAGIRKLARPLHSLRHSFAAQFLMQGGHLLSLKACLGHADIAETMVYAHLAPDFLDGEFDRIKL